MSIFDKNHLEWLEDSALDDLRAMRLELAGRGAQIIDLSMINPDLPPPRFLLDRLMEASFKPWNHRYAVSRGVRKLREGFAQKYETAFGVTLDPECEICATMGTKDALLHTLMVVGRPGQKMLCGAPAYPAHVAAARLAGLQCVYFQLQNDLSAMLDDIRQRLAEGGVRVILVNFPNNPTGISVDRNFYAALLAMARDCAAFVVNDFVYGEMGFREMRPPSLLACAESVDAVAESYSLSKAYNVAGWRAGALLGNRETIRRLSRLKAQIDYGIFLPVQLAAAAALNADFDMVSATTNEYFERCRALVDGLCRLGWKASLPSAGASIWAAPPKALLELIADGTMAGGGADAEARQSLKLAEWLLKEAGVLVTPGSLFGPAGDGHVRFAAVAPLQVIREVLARIGKVQKEPAFKRGTAGTALENNP